MPANNHPCGSYYGYGKNAVVGLRDICFGGPCLRYSVVIKDGEIVRDAKGNPVLGRRLKAIEKPLTFSEIKSKRIYRRREVYLYLVVCPACRRKYKLSTYATPVMTHYCHKCGHKNKLENFIKEILQEDGGNGNGHKKKTSITGNAMPQL